MWQEVANEVKEGHKCYTFDKITKNDFVAIATEDADNNYGLPFWLGKVVQKKEQCAELVEGTEEMEELQEGIQVEEWNQSQKNPKMCGEGKTNERKYQVVLANPSAKGRNKNQALRTWVPLTSVLYAFKKLTGQKSLYAKDANWVAFNAEVLWKCKDSINPCGVANFNNECGYKTLPKINA